MAVQTGPKSMKSGAGSDGMGVKTPGLATKGKTPGARKDKKGSY